MIFKIKFEKSTVIEIFSSFFFSVGAGYILIKTEFIVFTMIAHLRTPQLHMARVQM